MQGLDWYNSDEESNHVQHLKNEVIVYINEPDKTGETIRYQSVDDFFDYQFYDMAFVEDIFILACSVSLQRDIQIYHADGNIITWPGSLNGPVGGTPLQIAYIGKNHYQSLIVKDKSKD